MKVFCLSIDIMNADKPPASLAFLAGACEAANVDYKCVSLNNVLINTVSSDEMDRIYNRCIKSASVTADASILHPILERITNDVSAYSPDLIMISVFSFMQQLVTIDLLNFFKKKLHAIDVIIGGPGIPYRYQSYQTFGKYLVTHNLVTYYCLGEGDVVLPQFILGNRNLKGINSSNSETESWVPQIDDLDSEYLTPSYKKIDTSAYHNLENKNAAIFSLSTSRGCVRKCTFCDVETTWHKFRFRSGHSIANEILKHHRDVNATHFTIVDSLINGSIKSFSDFNLEMVKLKQLHQSLASFSYNGMFIVRNKLVHKEELFKSMRDAGCESLAIGVETGSENLRFQMEKKFTNEDLDYHLEMCSKYGIRNTLLMFVAYPTETREDFEQSLLLLERYQKYLIDDTIIGINHSGVFSLIEGTPVFNHREEMGVFYPKENTFSGQVVNWFNKNNPSLTVKERALRDLEFRKKALDLRYPVPYARRYVQYLKDITKETTLLSD